MGRKVEKPYNGGQWTKARFSSFIKSALRQASMRWGPKNEALRDARVRKGWYICAECSQEAPTTVKKGGKRVRNIHVDHILPVIDPAKGFESWDKVVERMFCEKEKLRVLCADCHSIVTTEERRIAKERRDWEKMK